MGLGRHGSGLDFSGIYGFRDFRPQPIFWHALRELTERTSDALLEPKELPLASQVLLYRACVFAFSISPSLSLFVSLPLSLSLSLRLHLNPHP